MAKRNFKLFNHWLAEVREIALGQVYHADEETKDGKPRMMSKSSIKWVFNKELMQDYFLERLTPQEAFEEEISYWDNLA